MPPRLIARRTVLRHGATAAVALSGLPALAAPMVLHDALGRRVVLPAPPQRIVTIFSSNTELVVSLGMLDRIVGVEDFTRFPPEVQRIAKVGGRLGFSADAVVAQRPDLVVVTPARQAAHQLVAPMERIGVPILVLLSRSLDEVLGNVRLIAQAGGARVAGRALPSMLMLTGRLGNGMLLVARADTYTGEAMLRAGGRFAL